MAALGSIIAHCGNLFSAKRVEKQHCGKAEPWKGQRWRLQGGGKSSIRQAAGCQMNISRENTCPPPHKHQKYLLYFSANFFKTEQ